MDVTGGGLAPQTQAEMDATPIDPYLAQAEAYALGTLDGHDRDAFEAHLDSSCHVCAEAVSTAGVKLGDLGQSVVPTPPAIWLRQQVLDLADAPVAPVDPTAYAWEEPLPGIRIHVVREDPSRGLKACLVWAAAGAKNRVHRHKGKEIILVLQGRLRDDRGVYGPGDVCRSSTGSVHTEEILPDAECVCYVLYYGELEYL